MNKRPQSGQSLLSYLKRMYLFQAGTEEEAPTLHTEQDSIRTVEVLL